MKSKIYYVTYKDEKGFTVIKPYIATSEKNAMKMFNKTNVVNKHFIKISTEMI